MIMATAAVVGLSTGKRLLLGSTFYHSDLLSEKLACPDSHSQKAVITAKKSSNFISNRRTSPQSVKALKEHVVDTLEPWLVHGSSLLGEEEPSDSSDTDYLVDAVLLLQKSMLEKQWNLSPQKAVNPKERARKKIQVTRSGTSARCRRIDSRKKVLGRKISNSHVSNTRKQWRSIISPELLQKSFKGYVKGIISEELLTHAEVVHLSQKIKAGLMLEERKSRYSTSSLCHRNFCHDSHL